jgi:hypothetical protein
MAHPLIGKYQKTAFDKLSADQRLEARQEIKDALAGKAGAKISQEDRVILMQRWISTFDNPPPQEEKPANEGKKRQFSLKLPTIKLPTIKLPAIKLPAMKRRTEKKPATEPAQKAPAKKTSVIKAAEKPAPSLLPKPLSISPLHYAGPALAYAISISLLLLAVLVARYAIETFSMPSNGEQILSGFSAGTDLILGSAKTLVSQILSVAALALLLALPLIPAAMIAGSLAQRMRANELQLADMICHALALGQDPAPLWDFARKARIPKTHFDAIIAQAKRESFASSSANFAMPADMLAARGNVAAAHFHLLFEQLNRISKLPNASEIGTHILGRTDGSHAEKAVWLVLQKQISN